MSLLEKIMMEVDEIDEVGELVALLRSSRLPTVVVEESSDTRIYMRWVERRLFSTYKVDVLAAGGKDNLLSVYDRRNEFADLPVVFVANQGMWVFSGVPEEYKDIVCTRGYSFENDVYTMSGIEKYALDPNRAWEHWLVWESVIRWFAFEFETFIPEELPEGDLNLGDFIHKYNFELEAYIADLSLDTLVPKDDSKLNKLFCKQREFRWPRTEIMEEISEKYRFDLPGKLLFQMLDRFSNTSLQVLYNTALANYESKPQNLILEIKRKLDEQRLTFSQEILSERKKRNPVPLMRGAGDAGGILLSGKPTLKSDPVVDRFVNDLRNAGLPTVVVEGKNNINLIKKSVKHHRVEESLDVKEVKVMSILRRQRLLSVYERKDEFVHRLPVAFVADREMWLFSGVPACYPDIICTQGYSFENDLYIDADLELLLEPHEAWRHRQVLNSAIEWFAFEVEEFMAGRSDGYLNFRLSEIIPQGEFKLDERFCQRRGFRQPSTELVQRIREGYKFLFPGSLLFEILARFLSVRGRGLNFNVTNQSLYEIAYRRHDAQLHAQLYNLIQKIIDKLDDEEERIGTKMKSSISQRRKINNRKNHRVESKSTTKQLPKPKSKRNQTWKLQNTQPSKPLQLLEKSKIKLGGKVDALILKKDGIKVTVQLQTDHKEEIIFEYPYYPKRIGDRVKLKVIGIDNTGRIKRVIP